MSNNCNKFSKNSCSDVNCWINPKAKCSIVSDETHKLSNVIVEKQRSATSKCRLSPSGNSGFALSDLASVGHILNDSAQQHWSVFKDEEENEQLLSTYNTGESDQTFHAELEQHIELEHRIEFEQHGKIGPASFRGGCDRLNSENDFPDRSYIADTDKSSFNQQNVISPTENRPQNDKTCHQYLFDCSHRDWSLLPSWPKFWAKFRLQVQFPEESLDHFMDQFHYVICSSGLLAEEVNVSLYSATSTHDELSTKSNLNVPDPLSFSRFTKKILQSRNSCVVAIAVILNWVAHQSSANTKIKVTCLSLLSLLALYSCYSAGQKWVRLNDSAKLLRSMSNLIRTFQDFDIICIKSFSTIHNLDCPPSVPGFKIDRSSQSAQDERFCRNYDKVCISLSAALDLIAIRITELGTELNLIIDNDNFLKILEVYNADFDVSSDGNIDIRSPRVLQLRKKLDCMHRQRRRLLVMLLSLNQNSHNDPIKNDIDSLRCLVSELKCQAVLMLERYLNDIQMGNRTMRNMARMKQFKQDFSATVSSLSESLELSRTRLSQVIEHIDDDFLWTAQSSESDINTDMNADANATTSATTNIDFKTLLYSHYYGIGCSLRTQLQKWEQGRVLMHEFVRLQKESSLTKDSTLAERPVEGRSSYSGQYENTSSNSESYDSGNELESDGHSSATSFVFDPSSQVTDDLIQGNLSLKTASNDPQTGLLEAKNK